MLLSKKLKNKVYRFFQLLNYSKKYYRKEKELEEIFNSFSNLNQCSALDIGSGPIPKNPFNAAVICGVDLRENINNNVIYADLSLGYLPFEKNLFDYISAYDLLEHISRVIYINGETKYPFINLMNEIFRVLKPGGIFFSIQPCFPTKEVFQDPTHVNIMSEDTISLYFCEPSWARIYGYEGSFQMIKDGWLGNKYFSFIKKSAEYPVKNLNYSQK